MVRRNRIFRKDPGLSFRLGAHTYAVKVEPGDMHRPFTDSYRACVRMDEGICFDLYPEEKLLAMTLADIVPINDFDGLPPEIRGVALEAALENLLERIEHFSGANATIETVGDKQNPDPSRPALCCTLTRTADGAQCRGALHTDEIGLEWLTAQLGRLPGKCFHEFKHLSFSGRIEIGRVDLTLTELGDLAPFDILVADADGALAERDIKIHCGTGLTLAGKLKSPDQVLIHNLIMNDGERLSMPPSEPPATVQTQDAIRDIPVTLVFEIGQTEVTIGELSQLQPGYTFQLSESLDIARPVTIRANGVAVGRGDIVQMGNTLGIRIREFSADTPVAAEYQAAL